jgi:hypothetical protein
MDSERFLGLLRWHIEKNSYPWTLTHWPSVSMPHFLPNNSIPTLLLVKHFHLLSTSSSMTAKMCNVYWCGWLRLLMRRRRQRSWPIHDGSVCVSWNHVLARFTGSFSGFMLPCIYILSLSLQHGAIDQFKGIWQYVSRCLLHEPPKPVCCLCLLSQALWLWLKLLDRHALFPSALARG